METYSKIQLIMELHCMCFSLAAGFRLLFNKYKGYQGGKILAAAAFVHAAALLSDFITWMTDGGSTHWEAFAVRCSNYMLFFLHIVLILLVAVYFNQILKEKNPDYKSTTVYFVYGCCIFGVVLIIITLFTGFCFSFDPANRYIRGPGFVLEVGAGCAGAVLSQVMVLQNRRFLSKKEFAELVSFHLFPVLGAIPQLFLYGYSFIDFGVTFSVLAQIWFYERKLAAWRKQKDLFLLQSQAYLLNSQIKPHFLFNSLNIIQALIEENPDKAVDAVGHFSRFLRTGLKVEVMNSAVPLGKELDYVDNYLYLEQLRHGDRLKIVRNIEPGIDFQIPFLTIQPIVENAVRHGVMKRLQGGTVVIDIHSEDGWYTIRIEDDGVGFKPVKPDTELDLNLNLNSDGTGAGVGVRNVEERIRLMCGGTMKIESAPGTGTAVTIRIPKKEQDTDDISGSR